MRFKNAAVWTLAVCAGLSLAGCTSKAAQDQQIQQDAARKIAEDDQSILDKEHADEAERAVVLKEQDRLDGVVQKQKKDAYVHSCQKVTGASLQLGGFTVDSSQCGEPQLRDERQWDKQQKLDDALDKAYGGENKNPWRHRN